MNVLSFSVGHQFLESYASHSVEVHPLVDGRPLAAKVPAEFNVLTVLGAGDVALLETDLYTCSCGVAGCAGIFDHCVISSKEDAVQWQLPEEPYRRLIDPALVAAGAPLLLTFDRAQYLAALASLRSELIELAARLGTPVTIGPGALIDAEDAWDPQEVADRLDDSAERVQGWIQREDDYRALWGDLLRKHVRLEVPGGYVVGLSVPSLGYLLHEARAEEESFDDEERMARDIQPLLATGDAAILTAARDVAWPALVESSYALPHDLDDDQASAEFQRLRELAEWPEGVRASVCLNEA